MLNNKGYVFFVDILGFSALTQYQINLNEEDYKARVLKHNQWDNSYFAAEILIEFREVLLEVKKEIPAINIAQLSDCAFLWSDNIWTLLCSVHLTMWLMIQERGILCRGGLGLGSMVGAKREPKAFGEFVVGSAVTMAVKNEGIFKGPRIAMDPSFPQELWNYKKKNDLKLGYKLINDIFHECENPINYQFVDEYRWYLCNKEQFDRVTKEHSVTNDEKKEVTRDRIILCNSLIYDPRMRWNTINEGNTHIQAGIKAISSDNILDFHHNFTYKYGVSITRSFKNLKNANNLVTKEFNA